MAVTRFVVVRSGADVFSRPRAWPRSDRATTLPGPHVEWFAWRLLLANNRDVGRSAGIFSHRDACLADIAVTRGLVQAAAFGFSRADGRWSWTMVVDSATVAVSSRSYETERESRSAAALFLDAVAGAALPD